MIPVIILAAALAGTAAVAYTFWDEIKKSLKTALERVKELVKGIILGVCTFIQTKDILKSFETINKFYSKNKNGQIKETIVTRIIDASDIPDSIKRRLESEHGEIDITNELENELGV